MTKRLCLTFFPLGHKFLGPESCRPAPRRLTTGNNLLEYSLVWHEVMNDVTGRIRAYDKLQTTLVVSEAANL
jgi:hypothetical protein